jgi:hypothetical protein
MIHTPLLRIILIWIFKKWDVDWIELSQDRDRWQVVMNLRVP